MPVPFLQLGDLKEQVTALLSHTRPVSQIELTQAINYGYEKGIRALQSVRPNYFVSYANFTFNANQTEYDLSNFDLAIERPLKMLVGAGDGQQRVIRFVHKSLVSPDFEEREVSRAASFQVLVYEILEGMFSHLEDTTTGGTVTTADATSVTLDDVTGFYRGGRVAISGSGAVQVVQGGTSVQVGADGVMTPTRTNVPIAYRGLIVDIQGNKLVLAPEMDVIPSVGASVGLRWTRLMKIVPALTDTVTGQLWFTYIPQKLRLDGDLVDPWLSKYQDMITAYALSQLQRAVDSAQSERWLADAQEMRSELMQGAEPVTGQNTEGFGSDLWPIGDF